MTHDPTNVSATDLARQLHITVPEILQRADDAIGDAAQREGLEAARGLSTHYDHGRAYLTAALAQRLQP